MRHLILAVGACALLTACPGKKGMVSAEALRPSVNAITTKFDELVDGAAERGEMNPVAAETWKGESALLRRLVAEDPGRPVLRVTGGPSVEVGAGN